VRRFLENVFGSIVYSLALLAAAALMVVYAVLVLVLVPFPLKALRWVRHLRGTPGESRPAGPGWQNAIANQFSEPERIDVHDIGELVAAVKRAHGARRKIRAVGSGHSFSDVAVSDDLMLELHGMKKVLPLDRGVLRAQARDARLVQVESGITIRELNQRLDEMKLALFNMGGYDAQTISGVVSTATHGSGHGLGAICDSVQSVELVREDGVVVRLEPAAGITDPLLYEQRYPGGPELVQDDQLFYSAVVSMGSMGIAYSYVLAVRDAYLLAETREIVRWEDLKKKLVAQDYTPADKSLQPGPIRHFEFLVNPYPKNASVGRECLVTYRWEVADGPTSEREKARNPLSTFLTGIRMFDRVIALVLNTFPRVAKLLLGSALRSLVDKLYVSKSYRVFNLGSANYVPAYAQELAFDAEVPEGGGAPPYLAALERLFELAGKQAEYGRWHTVPVSIRFIKASPHYLAMSHGRTTAIVEIPMLAEVAGGWELLRYYERTLYADFQARPHWGQAHFVLGPDRVRTLYPRFGAWLDSYRRLCPVGTFENAFAHRMGLRTLVEAAQAGWKP
jgi:hypothetical protein